MITTTDFQLSIDVTASPLESFETVCRVTEWWGEDIQGETRGEGSTFTIRFADTSVDFKITEFVAGKTVSWNVTNCYLPWLSDKSEWTGTTVRFDVGPKADGSQITLTHIGLRTEVECFEGCREGWTHHFGSSLLAFIQEGKGMPRGRDLHAVLTVPATGAEVFEAICKVSAWWSEEFEGTSHSLGDTFRVRFGDRHTAEFKISDISIGQRIVWDVTDSHLEWLENKAEWTGTKIIWVIEEINGASRLTLTHKGLEPTAECFTRCEMGWQYFVSQSLAKLITEGKGRPGFPATTEETK